MPSAVTLTITTGKLSGKQYIGEPWTCVLKNDAVPISQNDSSIPEKLAKVIDLAFLLKPKIHFPTAAEFKAALLKCV